MKTTLTVLTLALSLFATSSFAAVEIKNSKVINKSNNKDTVATASGENSTAKIGSIGIANAKIKRARIINKSKNKNAVATASGKGSTAKIGSIDIQ